MSLVRHVTAQEGIDNAPDAASLQLGRRRSHSINYDLTNTLQNAKKIDPVGADHVSRNKRLGKLASRYDTPSVCWITRPLSL